ncbi:hypothetical protein ALC56_11996 [Trachymyrmex septentrionalis]|uniref:Uncharacterized protein n=1 Tax=Trachymyrmex septentrionalis TaxID=34720 RepID=A0A195EZT7_9HYME|nr:hypothetical protein ALC56_11996 [Trachymyrmex septentrionalis]
MSETGHLPTDVESSDRDPGAVTLQPGPSPRPPALHLGLPGSPPNASVPSDSPHQETFYSPPASPGPPSDRRNTQMYFRAFNPPPPSSYSIEFR